MWIFVILMCLFWILGEPAFFDALLLLKELENAPEAGTTDNPKYRAEHIALYTEACNYERNTGNCKHPPAPGAEMVLALDYDGVKTAYYQKGDYCYQ